jgi:transposase
MMPESLPGLLRLGRNVIETLRCMNRELVHMLESDPILAERVARLMSGPDVGVILALTWALEIGNVSRFPSQKAAIRYCGLCGAEQSSVGKTQRTPISKQRNKHFANYSYRSRSMRCFTTAKRRKAIAIEPHLLSPGS